MSKKRLSISAVIALLTAVTSANALSPPASNHVPGLAVTDRASTAALSPLDASLRVRGYLEYIDALKDRADVSLERMQAAVGSQLGQGELGYISSAYLEGDWVTFSFWDEGVGTVRSASLNFSNDESPADVLPSCRLPLDSLRDRLSRVGYAEGREWSELEGAGAWLFSKDDVWIEVSTPWPPSSGSDPLCVTAISAHGKF